MLAICFYFQIHQPFRLKQYRIKQIGKHTDYFHEESNKSIFLKVAQKCYWPTGRLFASLLKRFPKDFKLSFSLSGTFLEQCEKYDPKLLEFYQEILSFPNTEILCETSHHSLASLWHEDEFLWQIEKQKDNIKRLFQKETSVFRNTELIYSNDIGKKVYQAGFKTCLMEGWDPLVPTGWNAHHVFSHPEIGDLKLLPKSYQLSDDIAFRFSNQNWEAWPLTAEKYIQWLSSLLDGNHEFIGLFMDYETFGEHQWSDTGIFSFMDTWISSLAQDPRFCFLTVSETAKTFPSRASFSVEKPLSWADSERDISAWLGNQMQKDAFHKSYHLKDLVHSCQNHTLMEEWRKLLTSDHLYYMCVKWSKDGDVHKYFSPFESPYEAYLDYMNILEDLESKCHQFLSNGCSIPKLELNLLKLNSQINDRFICVKEELSNDSLTRTY